MKRLLSFGFILFSFLLDAQTTVKGIVTELNSGNKPVAGVQIKVLGSSPELTDNSGMFKMIFTTKKPGDRIIVSEISKKGYEIVNKDVVNNWVIINNSNDKTKIVMCPEGLIAQNTLKYYDISLAGLTKGYTRQIASLKEQKEKAQIDAKAYLEHAKSLAEQFENQQKQLEELADKFARENFDDCSVIHQQAFEVFKLGNIIEAIRILETVNSEIEIAKAQQQQNKAKKMLSQSDSVIQQNIKKLMFQADLYKAGFRFSEAEKTYGAAVSADTTNIENVIEFAKYLRGQKEYNKSIKWSNVALTVAKTEYERVIAITNMAWSQFVMYQYEKSEANFNEALKIMRGIVAINPQENKQDLAIILDDLTELQRSTKKYGKAEKNINESLKIKRELVSSNPEKYSKGLALSLSYLADLQNDMSKYKESEANYNEALNIYRNLVVSDPQFNKWYLGRILNNLAVLQLIMKKYAQLEVNLSETEANLSESLEIMKEAAKKNPDAYTEDLATLLSNLAQVQSDMKQYDKSEANRTESLNNFRELAKSNPQMFMPKVARALSNMGVFYFDLKQYQKSEVNFIECLIIFRELARTNPEAFNFDLSANLFSAGQLYSKMKQFNKAEACFTESLSLFMELAKANPEVYNINIAHVLYELAGLYRDNIQYDKSITNYSKALDIFRELAKSNPKFNNLSVANTLKELAKLYRNNNQYDKSEVCFSDALKIYEVLVKNNPKSIEVRLAAECYGSFSFLLIKSKKFAKAETMALKGLETDSTIQWINICLAPALLLQGKYNEAKQIYLTFKDKKYSENKTYKDIYLADLNDFEKEGITHPDVAKIRELLKQ